jgi:hypothetical protein
VLGERAAGGVEAERDGQRDRAAADPHREEVGVGRAALPQPVGPVGRGPQPGQVGMEVLGEGELGGGQVAGPGGDVVEVAAVAGPLAAPGPVGGAAVGQAEPEPGQHGGGGPAGDHGDQPAGPGPGDREQERHRPPAADQRHQVLQPARDPAGGPAHRGRGCHRQLARRQGTGVCPHRAVHQVGGGHAGTLRCRTGPGAAPGEIVDNPDRSLRGA